jgi:hypothetical protein
VVLVFAAPASAQTVSEVLEFLVINRSVETGSVDRDREAAEATSGTIVRSLRASLATLPLTTSSGGFVYRLNPELGTVQRASPSFGPFFVERALTAGTRAASIGLTFQHLSFASLDGHSLRDGSLVTTANQFTDEAEPFDVDRLTLSIDADLATLHGNIGISDWMEVGVAVPFVMLRVNGSRENLYRGRQIVQASASATTVGVADLIVRTKVMAYNDEGTALAAAVDVRVPTAQGDDLLGTGESSVRFLSVGSMERGRFSSHANVGVSFGGLSRELSFGAAVGVAAANRVTITGEFVGRWIEDAGHVLPLSLPHPRLVGVNTTRLTTDQGHSTLISVLPGLKWNVSETWVLAASVGLPLTRDGLSTRATPFVGLDYAVQW